MSWASRRSPELMTEIDIRAAAPDEAQALADTHRARRH
jgi:hypothetical protein